MEGDRQMARHSKLQPVFVVLFVCFAMASYSAAASTDKKPAPAHAVAAKSMVPDNPSPHPAPDQPIPYSHKQHLALGLECKECHTNSEPGKLMTIPTADVCMQCHATIAKEKPAIQKLTEYSASKQPIPWVRVYQVLPGIEWSHRPHLAAGVKCQTCHGEVAQMEKISEVTSVTTMYACLHCHELNHAKASCDTCHKH
jgi:hypothetical protein